MTPTWEEALEELHPLAACEREAYGKFYGAKKPSTVRAIVDHARRPKAKRAKPREPFVPTDPLPGVCHGCGVIGPRFLPSEGYLPLCCGCKEASL